MKQTLLIITLAFSIFNIAKDMGYEMAPKDTVLLTGKQCQEVIRSAKKAGISAVDKEVDIHGYNYYPSVEDYQNEMFRISRGVCPHCGKKGLLLIAFSTSLKTWENLCGRRGYLIYCEDCHTVIDWRVTVVN